MDDPLTINFHKLPKLHKTVYKVYAAFGGLVYLFAKANLEFIT